MKKIIKINKKILGTLLLLFFLFSGHVLAIEDSDNTSISLTVEEGAIPPAVILPEVVEEVRIIGDVNFSSGENNLNINWNTNKDTTAILEWGETSELMDGTKEITENKREHEINLENLEPDTDYYFRIIARDRYGHEEKSEIFRIRTKGAKKDKTAPANIADFRARWESGKVILEWTNPADKDFRAVRIKRGENFYPLSFQEGEEIYNDAGEKALDGKAEAGRRYYYTAFSYDNSNNYSSGSLVSIFIPAKAGALKPEEEIYEEGEEEGIVSFPAGPPAKKEELLELKKENLKIFVANGKIELGREGEADYFLPGAKIILETAAALYPKNLKSIVFTIAPLKGEKKKEARSYLLRIDEKGDKYTAVLTAPLKKGDYDTYFNVLDYKYSRISRLKGWFRVEPFGKIMDVQDKEIYGAKITLFKEEKGRWVRWPGEEFSQFNPLYSNAKGQYGFLAPAGKYFLTVKKDNFFKKTFLVFSVENNLVNQDMQIIYYPPFNYLKLILIMLFSLLTYWLFRNLFFRLRLVLFSVIRR